MYRTNLKFAFWFKDTAVGGTVSQNRVDTDLLLIDFTVLRFSLKPFLDQRASITTFLAFLV